MPKLSFIRSSGTRSEPRVVRLPRFFSKKRGERRTDSPAWGSVGEWLFHVVLLLAGVIFATVLLVGVAVPEWRINNRYREGEGVIVGKGVARTTKTDLLGSQHRTWRPVLRVRYLVAGRRYEGWDQGTSSTVVADRKTALAALGKWQLGETVPCWFDPESPDSFVMVRGYNWWMWLLTFLLPGALVASGGAGVVRGLQAWGKSEERRSAAAQVGRIRPADPASDGGESREAVIFPAVPSCDDLVNSPGTVLRYRLPIESPETWTMIGTGLFAVCWNAVVVILAVTVGLDLAGGKIDWWLLGLLGPFVAVGVGAIVLFLRELVFTSAIGPTHLEMSDHPLLPGGRYDVLLVQTGTVRLRRLELAVELEERATFRQGTDTRTERLTVWRNVIGRWSGVEPVSGTPFEARIACQLPEMAMHSFESAHNAVVWRLVVRGLPERWPAFSRMVPLVVAPAGLAPSAEVCPSPRGIAP